MKPRRRTRPVRVGDVIVGGDAPVSVQSMTTHPAVEVDENLAQISSLADAGCEIVRVAVPDRRSIDGLRRIVESSPIPVVADVHFSLETAIRCVEAGVPGVRINPGNTRDWGMLPSLAASAKEHGTAVRVGANSGSVRHEGDKARGMVDLCLDVAHRLENAGFGDVILSFKSSSCDETLRAYRIAAGMCDYPFHVGLTAAGPYLQAVVRSSFVIGALLAEGIGDTVRVSLSAPPVEEVKVAFEILSAVGRLDRVEVVSCPTCGRSRMDVVGMACKVKEMTFNWKTGMRIAIMGCEVNGPGEAADADVGIAGGGRSVLLFAGGRVLRRVPVEQALRALMEEARKIREKKS